MKKVYHGSPNGDLIELIPNKSTHQENYVYATESPAIALVFAVSNLGDLDFDLRIVDNKVIFTERMKDSFEKYKTGGYLYTLDGEHFVRKDNLWHGEVVSTQKEKIESCEYIPNVLEKMEEYEKEGKMVIYRYPNKPDYLPKDDSDLVDKYINFEKIGHKGSLDMLLMYYPHLKEKVFEKLDNPKELYYVDKLVDKFDEIEANDNVMDAICRYDSPIWVRDDGWLNYNIEDNKFVFEKGGFNYDEDFYLYRINGDIERQSAHSFKVKNVEIISSEKLDLSTYEISKSMNK